MASPPNLAKYPVYIITNLLTELVTKPIRIVDVGCGSGAQMQRITAQIGEQNFSRRVGVDWAANAIQFLNATDIFDENVHCRSNRLPFADKEFDVALCMENLEHLYSDAVIPAIAELTRIARFVIITLPLPTTVINHQWLDEEIPLAEQDPIPLGLAEFLVIEGAVHKSVVYPTSMQGAGFSSDSLDHGCYFGISDNIDLSKIEYVAIDEPAPPLNTNDYRQHYVQLLYKSKALTV